MSRPIREQLSVEELAARPIEELVEVADRAGDAAERAFRRWFEGEVSSSSGAAALEAIAQERDADVRLHPDYDPALHGPR